MGAPKHHLSGTKLHDTWMRMISRCEKESNKDYRHYGGRGISVCEEWHDYVNFHNWAMANGYDPNAPIWECTLDRIDNDGDYCPENCRWVDAETQHNNQRNNHYVVFNGEKMTVAQLAKQTGVNYRALLWRINDGWTAEDAVSIPFSSHNKFKRNNKRYVMRDDGAVFESVAEAARESGCSPSGVSNVICGNRKSIKGMTFTAISEDEYADEIRELLGGDVK